ncbi:MAG TPA: SCO family protein [Verrucomicrobiae bacterium]|nr:SCO family protein [Verrucomicrobiae bacterium]
MNSPGRTFPWTITIGLLLILLTLALAFVLANLNSRKPHVSSLLVYNQIADFTLTNQNGAAVSLTNLRGQVWVADIIFTRCPGPCLRMTKQMKELETALKSTTGVKLISLTTDPEFDTPEVLKRYAERFEADSNRWEFLTGTKKQIGDLAINSLKLAAIEKKPEDRESENDLFVHSTIFVVVDKRGQLRGVFETVGEGVDWPESRKNILDAVKELRKEG